MGIEIVLQIGWDWFAICGMSKCLEIELTVALGYGIYERISHFCSNGLGLAFT